SRRCYLRIDRIIDIMAQVSRLVQIELWVECVRSNATAGVITSSTSIVKNTTKEAVKNKVKMESNISNILWCIII
ncbi:MAG: hypothetical protein WB975_12170, partial [Nitrososphaeraceae archaeon]